ncbi:hypothetical protein PFISCL1PPCAC_17860, partial [Pristionchus fissidentatus]
TLEIVKKGYYTPIREGIEVDVINATAWHVTLMSNQSDNTVKFTWNNTTMLKCDRDTKGGQDVLTTNFTVVRS